MAFKLGTQEATDSNRKYLSLRIGKLCETSKEPRDGFVPAYTENKAGLRSNFFAKGYEFIVAYVRDLKWRVKELDDGTKLQGWDIVLDGRVGDSEVEYLLHIGEKDHPFQRFMNCLANCDFTKPIKFSAFKGTGDRKVLCLYQDDSPGAKTVPPKYRDLWLDKDLLQKLRNKIAPSEEEKKNLAYDANGTMLGQMKYDEDEGRLSETGYPYITQKVDGKWNLTAWTEFLKQKVEQDVIPAIQQAAAQRLKEGAKHLATAAPKSVPDGPSDDAPNDASEPEEDSIPF